MPDVVSNDELNALAAEYVLGTLDYEERKGASALLEVDPTFRGIVRIWERRFGDLHLMVEAVEPDPQLWAAHQAEDGQRRADRAGDPVACRGAAYRCGRCYAGSGAGAATAPAVAAPPTAPAADAPPAEPTADAAVAESTRRPMRRRWARARPPASRDTAAEARSLAKPAADAKPTEAPPAVVEAELKLAELAALLPVTGDQSRGAADGTAAPAEPVPEDGLHTHAPDLVPRGFVPPAPMSTRGTPAVVEVPVVQKGGRGWMAATLAMALIAVALAGLISAWRFFPERLPAQLRANTLLNPTTRAAQPAPEGSTAEARAVRRIGTAAVALK